MAKVNWNQSEIEVQDSFVSLSDGWHDVMITGTDVVESDYDHKDQVVIDFTSVSGASEGQSKKVWLSLYSDNETVARIANQHLKQISESVGIDDLQDTCELENKTLRIKLYTKGKYQNLGEIAPSDSTVKSESTDKRPPAFR